jgi:hypothetical protein
MYCSMVSSSSSVDCCSAAALSKPAGGMLGSALSGTLGWAEALDGISWLDRASANKWEYRSMNVAVLGAGVIASTGEAAEGVSCSP